MASIVTVPHALVGDFAAPESQSLVNDHDLEVIPLFVILGLSIFIYFSLFLGQSPVALFFSLCGSKDFRSHANCDALF